VAALWIGADHLDPCHNLVERLVAANALLVAQVQRRLVGGAALAMASSPRLPRPFWHQLPGNTRVMPLECSRKR
jgi:hypothetical protein